MVVLELRVVIFYLEHVVVDRDVSLKVLGLDLADQLAEILILLQGVRLHFEFVAEFVQTQPLSGYIGVDPRGETVIILRDVSFQFRVLPVLNRLLSFQNLAQNLDLLALDFCNYPVFTLHFLHLYALDSFHVLILDVFFSFDQC